MNEKFTNINPEDADFAEKLNALAQQTALDPHFANELDRKLKAAHKPKTIWFTPSSHSILPSLGWVALVVVTGLALIWTIENLVPKPQPASNPTPSILETATPSQDTIIHTSPPYWGLRDYGTAEWEGGDPECDHNDDAALAERLRQKKSMIAVGERIDGSTRTRAHDEQIGKPVQFLGSCGKCGATRIDSQLGLESTPELYVEKMVSVFREVRRILRDDGTLWLNLGDSYAGNGGIGATRHWDGRDKNTQNRQVSKVPLGLKPKDLVGIPWRVAFALQADGWWLRQDIIWAKPNPMPESVTDRCYESP